MGEEKGNSVQNNEGSVSCGGKVGLEELHGHTHTHTCTLFRFCLISSKLKIGYCFLSGPLMVHPHKTHEESLSLSFWLLDAWCIVVTELVRGVAWVADV